jgi:hypothetical protein
MATAPTSFVVASEQLRGQPAVASFSFPGDSRPWKRFSIAIPRPVLSPTPYRQNSVPTHVLHVRNAFEYACPEGIPSSRQTAGSSSFGIPSRSMRCPPVIFTILAWCRSATSAIVRSCAGLVTPPKMRGMTLNVPSRWMLAWTRSFTKRASRSSW